MDFRVETTTAMYRSGDIEVLSCGSDLAIDRYFKDTFVTTSPN